jgi:hypothetical protein
MKEKTKLEKDGAMNPRIHRLEDKVQKIEQILNDVNLKIDKIMNMLEVKTNKIK